MKEIIINDKNLEKEDIEQEVVRVKGLILNSQGKILIAHNNNTYQFPGGHTHEGESLDDCVIREIKEETGLSVRLIDGFRTEDEHPLIREGKPETIKKIIYFAAVYENQETHAQESEITEIRLMTYEEAMKAFCMQ